MSLSVSQGGAIIPPLLIPSPLPSLPLRRQQIEHQRVLEAVRAFVGEIPASPRAQRDLLNWNRRIAVKTGGGSLGLALADQAISDVEESELGEPDLTLAVEDPNLLVAWTEGASIVNLIRTGDAGITNLQDMETIFKLDRLPRSIRRDAEQAGAP